MVVTKISCRGMLLWRTASPTSCSLPYILAVSMCRYPVSKANATASRVSPPGCAAHVPKPSRGILLPSLRDTRVSMESFFSDIICTYFLCDQPTLQLMPPSTGSDTPVMKRASSLAKNKAALATSQASPILFPSGTRAFRAATTSSRD